MKRVLFLLTVLILVTTGCGETEEAIPTNTPVPTPVPTATATPVPTPTLEPTATTIPAADFVAEGDELLWESDWEGAEAAYAQAIELHPSDPLAYAHLAYLHVQRPQTQKQALDEAQQAVDLAPEDAEILAYLVKVLDYNARFDEALEAA
jgi:Tfp pilus assembly protein PilF